MKKSYLIVLYALSALVLSWFLPWLYSLIFPVATPSPYLSYSPVSHSFVVATHDEDGKYLIYTVDKPDELLTRDQRDSLLPQTYFTQLIAHEKMPDSLGGYELSVPLLRHNQWVFTLTPRDVNKVQPEVYLLMESMPERFELENPTEVFRITSDGDIEIISMEGNAVNPSKSRRFSEIFKSRGFKAPLKHFWANINPRKAYDEGYLLVDAEGTVFHLKMQAGRPYMMRVNMPGSVKATHAFVMENMDPRHLGLIVSEEGDLYALEKEGYKPVKLPVGHFDPTRDRLTIVKDLFNWVIKINNDQESRWTAMDAIDYTLRDTYAVTYEPTSAEKVAQYLFPYTLSFTGYTDCYAHPRFADWSWRALFLGLLLAVIVIVIRRRSVPRACLAGSAVITLFLGLFFFIPYIIFNPNR